MSKPIAKKGSRVVGIDTHVVLIEGQPVPMQLPFNGQLDKDLSSTVFIDDAEAALVDSTATNTPHVATGGTFQKQPADKGTVSSGSTTVLFDEHGVARAGDPVKCCNDYADADTGQVVASGTVFAG